MTIRSVLIAPAGDADAVRRALAGPADVIAFDLTGGSHDEALGFVVEALIDRKQRTPTRRLWIAVSPLDTAALDEELSTLAPLRPDAFVLRAAASAADVQHLGALLAVEEAQAGFADGALRIVAEIAGAPALFELNAIARASARLDALMWDGEAFARDLGAEEAREADGRWTDPLQTVRTLMLAACADAKLPAIDSAFSGASDEAFRREAETARRDGFSAKAALNCAQAEIVNAAFAAVAR